MSDGSIKVTDRRMFTEDGELRDEYRSLENPQELADPESPSRGESPKDTESSAAVAAGPSRASDSSEAAGGPGRRSGLDSSASRAGGASRPERPAPRAPQVPHDLEFMDLVAALAEPIPLFLGDAQLPGGKSAQDLERARFYIDLLQVLRTKTQGNLSDQEDAVLADLIYRLQLRYVEKQR